MSFPADQAFELAIAQAFKLRITMDPVENVSGWTTRFKLRPAGSATATIDKAGSVFNGAGGVLDVDGTAVETTTIPPGPYRWSVWRVDSGSEYPIAVGSCEVRVTAQTG